MKKISVLQITNTLELGGVERNIHNICKYLDYGLFEHFVISLFKGGSFRKYIDKYAKTICLEGDVKQIGDVIVNNFIDIVIIHRAGKKEKHWSRVLRLCNDNSVKVIFEYNVFGLLDSSDEDKFIDFHLHKSMSSYHKFVLSAKSRRNYRYIDRHIVNYNLIDVKNFHSMKLDKESILRQRESFGINKDDFALLRVGRPDVRKWGDLLLYVMPKVVKKIPNAKFIFMSAPKSRIKHIQNELYSKSVIFLDNTSDDKELAKIYSIADVYIHSSRRGESFGQTLVEAFAFKLPVVVNSTPWKDNAQIEIVDHMENGIIANTSDGFADAICYLYENPDLIKKFGDSGFNKAMRLYDADKVCKSLAKLILKSMKQKGIEIDNGYFSDQFKDFEIYPTECEIRKYMEIDYNRRLNYTWKSEYARKPGSYYNRLKWFLSDAIEVLYGRLGARSI